MPPFRTNGAVIVHAPSSELKSRPTSGGVPEGVGDGVEGGGVALGAGVALGLGFGVAVAPGVGVAVGLGVGVGVGFGVEVGAGVEEVIPVNSYAPASQAPVDGRETFIRSI